MLKKGLFTLYAYVKKGVGVLLFVSCSFAIYHTVFSNTQWAGYWQIFSNSLSIISWHQWVILFLGMFANFIMEALKWKKVIASYHTMKMLQSLKAVLVGQTFAFFTPNRIGEYAGRALYLESHNKWLGVAHLAWASYAQLLVTIFFGSIALSLQVHDYTSILGFWTSWAKWGIPLIGIITALVYFNQHEWGAQARFLKIIQIARKIKLSLLILSLGRYLIFLFQYIWVAQMLHMHIALIPFIQSIAMLFLFLSILPTISFTELVIRGQLLLLIMAPIYQDKFSIITLSSLIWAVNFLIPSIIGAFLLLSYRLNQ